MAGSLHLVADFSANLYNRVVLHYAKQPACLYLSEYFEPRIGVT